MLMGDDFYISDLRHFESAFSFDQIKKQKKRLRDQFNKKS